MRLAILVELERIAGNRLDPAMRGEIADCIIKIIETAKLADLETVKKAVSEAVLVAKNGTS